MIRIQNINIQLNYAFFVDDLDQCLSKTVVEVPRAVILLLVDTPVSCWLAIEPQIIIASIEGHSEGVLDAAGSTGHNYLRKIVQIPFCIPKLDDGKKKNFLNRAFFEGQLDPVGLYNLICGLDESRVIDKILNEDPTAKNTFYCKIL